MCCLSSASLLHATQSGANLLNVKINDRTNFENANLTSAYLSSLVTDITQDQFYISPMYRSTTSR